MKALLWLLGILTLVVVGGYTLLFTGVGNSVLQPLVENKINTATNLSSKFSTFSVSFDAFEIRLELDADNSVYAKGTYSLGKKSVDLMYEINLNKLENLHALTKKEYYGVLNSNGNLKGDEKNLHIDGKSDIATSNTTYKVELVDLKPSSVIAKIQNADLIALLKMLGEQPYADAKLDIDVDFKDIRANNLDGGIVLVSKNGKLNHTLINKDMELDIPKTSFTMNLDAKLKGDDVSYKYGLKSNLAQITSSGRVVPQPLTVDATYSIDVKELALIKPITKLDFRGPYKIDGTVKGTKEEMLVKGKSGFASSDTNIEVVLENLKAKSVNAHMKHIDLKKVLYMVKQPDYARGVLNLDVEMDSIEKGALKGVVHTAITKGVFNSALLSKEQKFKVPMPATKFTLASRTDLDGDIADTKLDFRSTLADLNLKKASYNLKQKSIESDYVITIPNLDSLYFLTERNLIGALKANGDVKKDEDLDVTLYSKIAGGILEATMHNEDIQADLKSIQTLEAMKLLKYPPVFKAVLDGKATYNTKEKKGKFKATVVDGGFEDNLVFAMVKQYGKIDMYAEKFNGELSANIRPDKVIASFDLRSRTSSIKTVGTKINSKLQTIDSKIDINANKHKIAVLLTGNKSKPKVDVDVEEVFKEQIKQKLGNFLQGLLR